MSGETEKQVSGWTVDTLKEFIEQRITDQDKAVQAALIAAKEAVIKAETATEKRFESVNEFRAQLADQSNTLMPRQEYSVQHRALEDRVTDLTDRLNRSDGKNKGVDKTIAYGITAVSISIAIVSLILAFNN